MQFFFYKTRECCSARKNIYTQIFAVCYVINCWICAFNLYEFKYRAPLLFLHERPSFTERIQISVAQLSNSCDTPEYSRGHRPAHPLASATFVNKRARTTFLPHSHFLCHRITILNIDCFYESPYFPLLFLFYLN